VAKNFYTYVGVASSKIFVRGIENGIRFSRKVDYSPTLFSPSNKPTEYTTIHGKFMSPIKHGSISDARQYIDLYSEVSGFEIYGNQRFEYAYISDNYKDEIDWDIKLIRVCNLDIEVGSENGFPDPELASEEITAITYMINDEKSITFGCGDYTPEQDEKYVKCVDETDLLYKFLAYWQADIPDIITGWNVRHFDILYLYNRIVKLLGEDRAKSMSPVNRISTRSITIMNRQQTVISLKGIAILDYKELYQKFAPNGASRDSYTLNNICFIELKEKKLEYDGTLHTLYKTDFSKYIKYNIRDTRLVRKLDDKLKLLPMAITLAYTSKTNFEDVFSQVRMWDTLIFNKLRRRNQVIPPLKPAEKDEMYVGAYVKEPVAGIYHYVASFDLDSLYPHLIMQYSISPDTYITPEQYTEEMKEVLNQEISVDALLNKEVDTSKLKALGVTLTPNGQLFDVTRRGFLCEMMEDLYASRKVFKNKTLDAKARLEKETDKDKREIIENEISRYNNLQLAMKVTLNSAYGALGNEFFRFFDIRQASAITTAGQLSTRWIEKYLNKYLNKVIENKKHKDYVIASDTDSVYLCLDDLVRKTIKIQNPLCTTTEIISYLDRACEAIIKPFIDESYQSLAEYINAYAQKMNMKREALCDKAIWVAKKRYILNVHNSEGVQYAKPEVKVTGLEVKRSSTPTFFKERMEKLIEIIMNGKEDDCIDYILQTKQDMLKASVFDISFPRSVNNIKKYSNPSRKGFLDFNGFAGGTPIHVRGAILFNRHLEKMKLTKKYSLIKEGEKIRFIYIKEPNRFRSNIIAFNDVLPKEFGLEQLIDYETQFQKAFVEPMKLITDAIGWKTERRRSIRSVFTS